MNKTILAIIFIIAIGSSIVPAFAIDTNLTIKGASSQSNNLVTITNSSGSNLVWIDSKGNILAKNNELRLQGSGGSNYAIFATPSLGSNVTITLPSVTSTLATLGANTYNGNQTIGTNAILGTNNLLIDTTSVSQPSFLVQSRTANHLSQFSIAPSGSSKQAFYAVSRNSSFTGNVQFLEIGSDLLGSNEFDIRSGVTGTSSQLPTNIITGSTYVMGFDTSNNAGMYAGKKFCLDFAGNACGNNYIVESSANVNDFYAGGIKVASFQSTGIVPQTASTSSSTYSIDSASGSNTITISNGATATPFGSTSNKFGGLIVISSHNDGETAVFLIGEFDGSSTLLAQTGGTFSTTANTASKTNVYVASNVLTIQNNRGGTQTYTIFSIHNNSD